MPSTSSGRESRSLVSQGVSYKETPVSRRTDGVQPAVLPWNHTQHKRCHSVHKVDDANNVQKRITPTFIVFRCVLAETEHISAPKNVVRHHSSSVGTRANDFIPKRMYLSSGQIKRMCSLDKKEMGCSHRPSSSASASRMRLVASERSSSTMHSMSRSGLKLGGTTFVLVMVSRSSHRKAVYFVNFTMDAKKKTRASSEIDVILSAGHQRFEQHSPCTH